MILRRVIKHFRKQEWTAIFIDFLIVVVGVFVGLQVNTWNQSRSDRQDEAVFLEDLHEDIEQVQTLSIRLFEQRRTNFIGLSDIIDVLNERKPAREFTKDDCFPIMGSDVYYVGRADFPSLIQLRNAGRTNIIKDRPLQKALARLTQSRDALDLVIASSTALRVDFRINYSEYFRFGLTMIPVPGRPGQMERHPTIIECDIEQLLENQEARNALTLNLEFYDAYMRNGLLPWNDQLQDVHDRLDVLLQAEHSSEGEN